MIQNILITGGAGFIGSRLALQLVARGHNVRVLDSLAPQIHGAEPESSTLFRSIQGKVEFIRGSVASRNDLLKALPGMDTVVHLAAETGTGQSMYAIQHYSDVNIGGTALLLDMIANEPFPVKKIVVASSRAVYGEGKYHCSQHGTVFPFLRQAQNMEQGDFAVHCPLCGVPAQLVASDEETPVRPASVYGITKLAQEQMVLTVGKALGISALAFRYQNVYGPGQSLSNPYTGILSIFSTRIRNRSGINIFEDGKESRDFVYIDDVVAVTARGIEYQGPLVDMFNVGSGVATDVMTIAGTLQHLLGGKVPIEISGQFRVGDIRHNVADLTKVRAILGFEPSVGIEEGLSRFIAWVNGEQIQVDRYEESLTELRKKGLFK
ncbi:NAD(P)-dependent oxidoreductase [Devosia sp.]|uniref:NAD-dependent epimerase/dehydratase family protein n=1 Tax=Devosia sp. TaxID=1871048 RepID=UPI002736096C|nr:NAD-dependent epimerase/dehydratase family protein [Devosia sp.]MDP2782488.1 NAD-dependent epimerase/dehydratase family protein [Devosia sp.]